MRPVRFVAMELELDVALDPTLGCGQAHRWRKIADDTWEGVIKNSIVKIKHTDTGISFDGSNEADVLEYFRADDDLSDIVSEIAKCDPYVADLSSRCPGLRILKQPEWECLATYMLATNVNVKRIAKMVESVCDEFGSSLGSRCSFPTAKQILDRKENIGRCKLGFREERFLEACERVESREIDIEALKELEYGQLVNELQNIKGVGPKVADCVALFGFGKLEAFPVDVRIQKVMFSKYSIGGSYKAVSEYGRNKFGCYAGYAQEFLYHSEFI